MKELLKIRNQKKKRKPNFVRQEANKRKKLAKKWRAPKGMHSKLRRKFKGKIKQPSIGFSSPKKVRGLTKDGYKKILVHNLTELNKIKEEIIELSRTLGLKKKLELLKKIKEKNLKVLNVKDVEKQIKAIEDKMAKRKEEAKKRKEKKAKTKAKKAPKKKEEKSTQEEKEKKEKEEKRKTLEKAK